MKTPKKKPSYSCLKETVRCANAEAQGYLDQVGSLRTNLEMMTADRDRWRAMALGADRLCDVLIRALQDAQKLNTTAGKVG